MKIKIFKSFLLAGCIFFFLSWYLYSFSLKELSIQFVESNSELWMQTAYHQIQPSDRLLDYRMYNNKRDDFYFSGETILAYFDNGEWKEVLDKMKRSYEERLYTLSLCPLPAGDSILLQLNLTEYGSLRAGKYKGVFTNR